MNPNTNTLSLGTFVHVGESLGVIVGLPETEHIPPNHYAIWFGESAANDYPKCRTVPTEYCHVFHGFEFYH